MPDNVLVHSQYPENQETNHARPRQNHGVSKSGQVNNKIVDKKERNKRTTNRQEYIHEENCPVIHVFFPFTQAITYRVN